MATVITDVEVHDVRFPTAQAGDGSDAAFANVRVIRTR